MSNQMSQAEVCRIRAEEFERNYMSLRDIEWRIALEIHAAFAAIGVAYFQLRGTDALRWSIPLGVGAIALTVVVFICFLYLGIGVQQRLRFTRVMRNEYLKRIHGLVGFQEIDPKTVTYEVNGKMRQLPQPRSQFYWAFWGQCALSLAAASSLILYALFTTPPV